MLKLNPDEFSKQRKPRFCTSNPQPTRVPFWDEQIRTGFNGWAGARTVVSEDFDTFEGGPTWSFDRFGMSRTRLPDGRVVCIAGEHEDHYDPDFNIYNDVVVFQPDGTWQMYLYLRDVFPPTDFHAAVLVGSHIYLLGCLGYLQDRDGPLPVYRLNTNDFSIERVETTGDLPPRLYRVLARQVNDRTIRLVGGENSAGKKEQANESVYTLDLPTLRWSIIGSQPAPDAPLFGESIGPMKPVRSFKQAWEYIDTVARGVPFDHPLWACELWPIYTDDTMMVLFEVTGRPFRYAVCNPPWAEPRQADSDVPCRVFADADAALTYLRDPASYGQYGYLIY